MTSITNNQLKSKWIIRDDAKDEYTYPSDSRILSRGYYDGPIVEHIHYGLDIPENSWEAIRAVADGVVSFTQSSSLSWNPYGNESQIPEHTSMQTMGHAIAINHFNPDSDICSGQYARSIYMHMIQPSLLSVGSTVTKGQIIGYVGSTGASSDSHLHFAFSVGDDIRMAPNSNNWITIAELPNKDAVASYFSEYHTAR